MSKKLSFILFLLLTSITLSAQKNHLYSKAFGSPANPPIIFLHGGPGYNCAGFEISTAQALADAGYYVIVYDQRGCARSKDFPDSAFTLVNNLADIDSIYSRYHLTRATLMGHSWGGTLATFYNERFPLRVDKLILVCSPVSFSGTFHAMLRHCKEFYTASNNSNGLDIIATIEKGDTTSLMYATTIFMHAFTCKLYVPKQPTDERKAIYDRIKTDPAWKYLTQNEFKPVQGLFNDIHHTMLNTESMLHKIKFINEDRLGIYNIFGIYGTDDGLFDDAQLATIRKITEPYNFYLLPGASHNVFIDQQKLFIDAVKKIMK